MMKDYQEFVKELKESFKYLSDQTRYDLIKNQDLPISNHYPDNDEIEESGENIDSTFFYNRGNYYEFIEIWWDSCWEGLYTKPEYKGLNKNDAIEKFIKERFTIIANKTNLKIIDWDIIFNDEYDILKIILKKEKILERKDIELSNTINIVSKKIIDTILNMEQSRIAFDIKGNKSIHFDLRGLLEEPFNNLILSIHAGNINKGAFFNKTLNTHTIDIYDQSLYMRLRRLYDNKTYNKEKLNEYIKSEFFTLRLNHELTHLYDETRNKTFFDNDVFDKFVKKYKDTKLDSQEKIEYYDKMYYNSNNEVNAFILQGLTNYQKKGIVQNNFKDFLEEFKNTYLWGWKHYNPKTKENITKRLYLFYNESKNKL